MEAPPHTPRTLSGLRIPRRRTKAQRDRQRGHSPANSISSSPEPTVWPRPQRKKKRRKREEGALVPEEDLIDGFCISSYGSLEAMQRDVSMDSGAVEESYSQRPPGKRKRSDGVSSEDPGARENPLDSWGQRGKKRPCSRMVTVAEGTRPSGPELAPSQQCLDAGYICDTESSADEQMPSDDLAVSFTISTSIASPPLSGGRLKLMVLSQISGLGRSCERSQEPEAEFIQPQPCQSPLPQPHVVPNASPKAEAAPAPPPHSVESRASSSRSSVPKPISAPQMSPRAPPPPLPLHVHTAPHSIPPVLRPPSHQRMDLFPNSQGLPPPPPLMQAPGHLPSAVLSEHHNIGLEMGSRFLPPAGGTADIGATIRPMYQFHQHNHQHTHQHTHQHFTPYPPNFEKFPSKIENLYRQNASTFYPSFSPIITTLPPVLPPSVNFGSMQGAFQPKSTSSELASRCSVPTPVTHKAPQVTEQFKAKRSGRWCAMHVRVAYMILRHQERLKLAHGTPHKAEFRGDLLCLNSGLAPLPSTLITGAASHPPGQFQVVSSGATFLPPSGPVDHFIRNPGFSPIASLTNGAFGGLGNPSYSPASIFTHKDAPLGHGFPGAHEAWSRLHRTAPSFPGAPDAHGLHLKEEKERDFLYSRLVPRVSPLSMQRLPGSDIRAPYVRPGSSSDTKPRLTPDHPCKVKVKEEPELLTFQVGRSPLPGIHLPHPSPPFERLRGAFLGEQYPNALEAWRDVYRRADPASHRLYDHREERAHILREDFERARVYGLPSHVSMQPAALYPHPGSGLLSKTPPINLLSAPPPLISSPPRRDIYKDRDCR